MYVRTVIPNKMWKFNTDKIIILKSDPVTVHKNSALILSYSKPAFK